ncbi:MAG: tetratricopeptide repeat protein [Desulfobacterales bacterium]|nr:tetratricopeptide repeat protein [Desulfobacterales bacterium]
MRSYGIKQMRIPVCFFILSLLLAAPCLPDGSSAPDPGRRWEIALEPAPVPDPNELADLAPLFSKMTRLLEAASERPDISRVEMGEAHGDLGRLYHAHGLARPAEICYRNARRLAPTDHRWPYYIAHLQQKEGRLNDALASWVNAMAVKSSSATLIHMAETLMAMNRLEEAAAVLGNARRLNPSSAPVSTLLGRIDLSLKRYRSAAAHFEEALAEAPDASRIHHYLARTHRGLGAEQEAKKHEAAAGDVDAPLYEPLILSLERLRGEEARNLLVGRQAERAGDVAAAVEANRAAVKANPDSAAARRRLGKAIALSGDREAALREYRRAVELAPDDAESWHGIGAILVARGSLESGAAHFRKALSLEPEYPAANLALARVLVESGQIEASLPFFTAVARASREDERAWLGGSGALIKLGRYRQASQVLSQAHGTLPESAAIAAALGRLLAASPDPGVRDGPRALGLALQAHGVDPTADHAEIVASAMAQLGRCNEAAAWQRRAIKAAAGADVEEIPDRLKTTLRWYENNQPCAPPPFTLD